MEAADVVDLQRDLAGSGLDWCVVGGWGVDALLGAQTRPHKDLDVLLPLSALDGTLWLLQGRGFRMRHLWEESRAIQGSHELVGKPMPSAFVVEDIDGREVDVHVYDMQEGQVSILWDTDRTLSAGDLTATGRIAGVVVTCMSAAKQLQCHERYVLPPPHAEDVRRLQRLIRPTPTSWPSASYR